jgi:tetratricopeptide (TPR) repeat protein
VALPSVVLLAAAAGAGWLMTRTDGSRIVLYNSVVKTAADTSDHRMRLLALLRLALLEDSRPEPRYQFGLLVEEQGEVDRARQIMQQLAIVSEPVLVDAYFWLARDALQSEQPQLDVVEWHLRKVLDRRADHLESHQLLAQVYLNRDDFDTALPHLEAAAAQFPENHITLASYYRSTNQQVNLDTSAAEARRIFDERFQRTHDLESALRLGQLEYVLGDYEKTATVLEEAQHRKADDRVEQALRQTYLMWASVENDDVAKLRHLERARGWGAEPQMIVAILLTFIATEGPSRDAAEVMLRKFLDAGQSVASCHYVLGTMAVKDKKLELARDHLEQAYKLSPDLPEVANNFAWVLSRCDRPDLERALTILNKAIDLNNQPEIRETRGQVLLKLGRYQEAVTDLEFAVNFLKLPEVHESLAEAYDKLGATELAEQHRKKARES